MACIGSSHCEAELAQEGDVFWPADHAASGGDDVVVGVFRDEVAEEVCFHGAEVVFPVVGEDFGDVFFGMFFDGVVGVD